MRHDRHYTLDEARAELPWVAEQLAVMRRARSSLSNVAMFFFFVVFTRSSFVLLNHLPQLSAASS